MAAAVGGTETELSKQLPLMAWARRARAYAGPSQSLLKTDRSVDMLIAAGE